MKHLTMHPDTTLGPVHLTVSDLGRSLRFYQDMLGLQAQTGRDRKTLLAPADGAPIVALTELPGARPKPPRTTGLYHFAVLLPSRRDLARVVQRFIETRYPVQGASDHGVSEALYLADPDGNGIEIYSDRSPDAWPRQNGALEMVTEPLNFDDLMAELRGQDGPWTGLPRTTRIGHVHLHVRDLREAEAFYTAVLGLDLMQRYGESAAFLSAGGYHHHVGINTWAGAGAPAPPADAVGLRCFTMLLPDRLELAETVARIRGAGVPVIEAADNVMVHDPAGNGIGLATR